MKIKEASFKKTKTKRLHLIYINRNTKECPSSRRKIISDERKEMQKRMKKNETYKDMGKINIHWTTIVS